MWQEEWVARGIPEAEWPAVEDRSDVQVEILHRLTAWEHRPPVGKIYVEVMDADGNWVGGFKVRFETEPSDGIAYDHPDIWGVTGQKRGNLGRLEWSHLQVPTRYRLYIGDETSPFISNLRTDLGYEYPTPPGSDQPVSWVPTNRPGIYSYRIRLRTGGSEAFAIPGGEE